MILEMIIFIGFSLVMMLLIAFFYFRDKSMFQKLSAYEDAIDDINSRLYELESLSEGSNEQENALDIKKAFEGVEERLHEKLNEVGDPLLRTIRAVKTMEENLQVLENRLNQRLENIEESTKFSSLKNNATKVNEQRIIELFREGKSIEKIAKKERVSQGEVELILRIANLR